ncbi:hypothetical protein [Spongiibacter marinus]|uniref:hypothetical protein n=1 Tax=Spongiibacter marinus TaxID=354246 RepID=UPI0035BE6E9F
MRRVQRAQSPWWLCGLLSLGMSLMLVSLIQPVALPWWAWLLMFVVVVAVLRRGYVTRSELEWRQGEGEPVLAGLRIFDRYSVVPLSIATDQINAVYLVHYASLWQCPRARAEDEANPYHRPYRQMGYIGPGLVLRYRLPAMAGDPSMLRSVQLPMPEAADVERAISRALSQQ